MIFHTARVAPEKAVFRPALPSCSMPGMTEMQMAKMTFAEQIKHPSWQKKRLEVLESAAWECENCGARDVTLNVHHKQYVKGRMHWEYERHELECLCETCHKAHHQSQDALRQLLAEVEIGQAFGLLAGFHHHSDWIDRDNALQGRDADALAYAAGLIGWMTYQLDIDQMHRVGEFIASTLCNEMSEARLVFAGAGRVFGKGE